MAVWIYWSCESHFGEPCFRWMDSSYHDINHREMNVTNMWFKAVQDSKWKISDSAPDKIYISCHWLFACNYLRIYFCYLNHLVQTAAEAHSAYCTVGTGTVPSSRG